MKRNFEIVGFTIMFFKICQLIVLCLVVFFMTV